MESGICSPIKENSEGSRRSAQVEGGDTSGEGPGNNYETGLDSNDSGEIFFQIVKSKREMKINFPDALVMGHCLSFEMTPGFS
ncbi:hypothetical protein GH714_023451 [Hevea brasiliensis]|uniref:Uncharacterized protein n=1 Tax=Hevea brasiliensis TaxID=3981 RepID=A0A6A6LCV7_HEVBR|nr:hypothetical protein GH714_023451 [Hevea brasiliensis]